MSNQALTDKYCPPIPITAVSDSFDWGITGDFSPATQFQRLYEAVAAGTVKIPPQDFDALLGPYDLAISDGEFASMAPEVRLWAIAHPQAFIVGMIAHRNPANNDLASVGAEGGISNLSQIRVSPDGKSLDYSGTQYLTVHDGGGIGLGTILAVASLVAWACGVPIPNPFSALGNAVSEFFSGGTLALDSAGNVIGTLADGSVGTVASYGQCAIDAATGNLIDTATGEIISLAAEATLVTSVAVLPEVIVTPPPIEPIDLTGGLTSAPYGQCTVDLAGNIIDSVTGDILVSAATTVADIAGTTAKLMANGKTALQAVSLIQTVSRLLNPTTLPRIGAAQANGSIRLADGRYVLADGTILSPTASGSGSGLFDNITASGLLLPLGILAIALVAR